jgi:DNA polymerase-3 subunit gamma/tau
MAPAPAPVNAAQASVHFDSLQALANYGGDNGQSVLKLDIERYVRLIKFEQGAIEFAAANQAPPRLAAQMKAALTQWTGRDWAVVIDTNAKGDDTILERRRAKKLAQDAADKNHPEILKTLAAFPGARLVEIRDRASTSNIIEADFTPTSPNDEDE